MNKRKGQERVSPRIQEKVSPRIHVLFIFQDFLFNSFPAYIAPMDVKQHKHFFPSSLALPRLNSYEKSFLLCCFVTVQVLWAAVVGRRDERLADHGHLDSIPEVAALFAAGAQVTANAAKHLRTLECAKAP